MPTALERACERLRQQELERKIRRECCAIRAKAAALKRKRLNQRGQGGQRVQPLEIWQYYLRQRRRLSRRIMKRTGKLPSQVLLNCSGATEKEMIQRLFDLAERLSPENQWRREFLLHRPTRCGLECTLPNIDILRKLFSIYGLPEVSKAESRSTCCIHNWFKSKLITQRLKEKKLDIINVLKHFPDVECLQIVGKAMEIHIMEPGKTPVVGEKKIEINTQREVKSIMPSKGSAQNTKTSANTKAKTKK